MNGVRGPAHYSHSIDVKSSSNWKSEPINGAYLRPIRRYLWVTKYSVITQNISVDFLKRMQQQIKLSLSATLLHSSYSTFLFSIYPSSNKIQHENLCWCSNTKTWEGLIDLPCSKKYLNFVYIFTPMDIIIHQIFKKKTLLINFSKII